MNKLPFVSLLFAGVALGVIAADSISSSFSRLLTGEPTDNTVWLLICGGVVSLVGLAGVVRGSHGP